MKPIRLFLLTVSTGLGIGLLFLLLPFPLFAKATGTSVTAVATTTIPASPIPASDLLQQTLTNLPADKMLPVIVYLREQVDPATTEAIPDPKERRAALVNQLQATAVASQEPLRQQLDAWQTAGRIIGYRPFWIINAIALNAPADVITELRQRPEVADVRLDESRPLIAPPTPDENSPLQGLTVATNDTSHSWGVDWVQAPYVWYGLGVDGAGVTVAIMDSGVDWLHPDLLPNYRGNTGDGTYLHTGNWYDTATPTNTQPVDVLGHGTHVAGTAVGQNGLGVAPGAKWIAVNIANANGLIYDSTIHAGFEWLLAPANNPALAPDVVNCSWGGAGWMATFTPDIAALHVAGILPIFAAGNSGPDVNSINAPASLPGTIAVGATDSEDTLAWFSSVGPSLLTTEIKPTLVAPGTRIFSALPGGVYGYANGTSMATPHVVGAAALLLSANPSLTRQGVTAVLTTTAVPITTTHPNMRSGWGRLNAYAAASAQAPHGVLQGVVRHAGLPLPGISLTLTTPTGVRLLFTTDVNGRYEAPLQSGIYQIATAPFGFLPALSNPLSVQNGQITLHDFDLLRPPSGTLSVTVLDSTTNVPLSATLTLLNTPITRLTATDGPTLLTLPAGVYQLRLHRTGYRLMTVSRQISANQTTAVTIYLTPTRRILLVDSGAWYYQSFADYYHRSLENLGYAHDYWPIKSPFGEQLPSNDGLATYDVVIWSAPEDSPGYIFSADVISDYLGTGGNMLISGQNVAYYDGYGSFTEYWFYQQLQGQLVDKKPVTQTLTGTAGTMYENLTLTLNGGDSANNQTAVDQTRPRLNALTDAIIYNGASPVALQADACRPFHLTYLGFGLEGVANQTDRDDLLARILAYFQLPDMTNGARWLPDHVDDFARPGTQMVYPLTVQNLSETLTDTFTLQVQHAPWPLTLSSPMVTIGPCQTAVVTATLDVPTLLPKDAVHDWQITAVSHNVPANTFTLPLQFKTPGYVLLVDDDRWYNQETFYQSALDQIGLRYDVWNIGWNNTGRGSPSLALLDGYEFVLWFTGYDWFQPVTPQERDSLTAYLTHGGRLFLSSQDFMYYHQQTALAHTYLGVLAYQETITPTQVYAGSPALPPSAAGPLPLTFDAFRNNSDGLIATAAAQPFLWHDQGMLAGIAHSDPNPQPTGAERPFRTVFWAMPLEKTPLEEQPALMAGIVGWLSDLGDSAFSVDRPVGSAGQARTYTITVRNLVGAPPNQVTLTNTLPALLLLDPATVTGSALYRATDHTLHWSGELASGGEHIITYQATPQAPQAANSSLRLDNTLTLRYARHPVPVRLVTPLWLNTPDLHASTLTAQTATDQPIQWVTYTLALVNESLVGASVMTAVLRLPDALHPLTHTLTVPTGNAYLADQRVTWQGALAAGETVTLSLTLTRTRQLDPVWLSAAAYLDDGLSDPIVRARLSYLPPFYYYFPVIAWPP